MDLFFVTDIDKTLGRFLTIFEICQFMTLRGCFKYLKKIPSEIQNFLNEGVMITPISIYTCRLSRFSFSTLAFLYKTDIEGFEKFQQK